LLLFLGTGSFVSSRKIHALISQPKDKKSNHAMLIIFSIGSGTTLFLSDWRARTMSRISNPADFSQENKSRVASAQKNELGEPRRKIKIKGSARRAFAL
jgi:hypothetical protein